VLLAATGLHPAAVLKGHRLLFLINLQYLAVVEKAAGQILGLRPSG